MAPKTDFKALKAAKEKKKAMGVSESRGPCSAAVTIIVARARLSPRAHYPSRTAQQTWRL